MERTELTRERHRASKDSAALYRLLDAHIIAHVALQTERGPLVVPTAIARADDRLLMHGSVASGWMRRAKQGEEVSVAVTQVDGMIVARCSFESSIRYHSAVIFGRPELVDDEHKAWALEIVTEKLLPGRSAEVRPPTAREIAQTMILSMPIHEWSLKISDGWPDDTPEDIATPTWAGVVLIQPGLGYIQGAPDLAVGVEVPASVRRVAEHGLRTDHTGS